MEVYLEQYGAWYRVSTGVLQGCPAAPNGSKTILDDGKPDWGQVEIPEVAHPQIFVTTINRALATRLSVEDFI